MKRPSGQGAAAAATKGCGAQRARFKTGSGGGGASTFGPGAGAQAAVHRQLTPRRRPQKAPGRSPVTRALGRSHVGASLSPAKRPLRHAPGLSLRDPSHPPSLRCPQRPPWAAVRTGSAAGGRHPLGCPVGLEAAQTGSPCRGHHRVTVPCPPPGRVAVAGWLLRALGAPIPHGLPEARPLRYSPGCLGLGLGFLCPPFHQGPLFICTLAFSLFCLCFPSPPSSTAPPPTLSLSFFLVFGGPPLTLFFLFGLRTPPSASLTFFLFGPPHLVFFLV